MLSKLLIGLIRLYQLTLSKLILVAVGPVCRFEPSCSRYAVACLRDHGALRGSLLSFKRLCRCQPFHPGGFDPPPPPRLDRAASSQRALLLDPPTDQPGSHRGYAHDGSGPAEPNPISDPHLATLREGPISEGSAHQGITVHSDQ